DAIKDICRWQGAPRRHLRGKIPGGSSRVRWAPPAPLSFRTRLQLRRVVQSHPLQRHLEPGLHLRVLISEVPGVGAELELNAVGILKVDRLRPLMIDHL